jgi:chromosome segregation ATPase
VVTGDRQEMRGKIAEAERKLDLFSREAEPAREAARSVARLWDEISKLRNEAMKTRTEIENRIVTAQSSGGTHEEVENTRRLLTASRAQFNNQVSELQKAVQTLLGMVSSSKDSTSEMVRKLKMDIDHVREEIAGQVAATERKLDTYVKETGPGRQAAENISKVWEELARLREDTASARMQIEERITSLRSGGMDVHTEIEGTRQLLDQSQHQLNSQVAELQKTVEQLQLMMKKDKSDLAHMVDELKEEVDQARLDFGIEESNALLKSLADQMDTGSAPEMTDEQAIDEITRTLSRLEDTP